MDAKTEHQDDQDGGLGLSRSERRRLSDDLGTITDLSEQVREAIREGRFDEANRALGDIQKFAETHQKGVTPDE